MQNATTTDALNAQFPIGAKARAVITKNGYAVNNYEGIIVGYTKDGRIKIESYRGIKCHSQNNVSNVRLTRALAAIAAAETPAPETTLEEKVKAFTQPEIDALPDWTNPEGLKMGDFVKRGWISAKNSLYLVRSCTEQRGGGFRVMVSLCNPANGHIADDGLVYSLYRREHVAYNRGYFWQQTPPAAWMPARVGFEPAPAPAEPVNDVCHNGPANMPAATPTTVLHGFVTIDSNAGRYGISQVGERFCVVLNGQPIGTPFTDFACAVGYAATSARNDNRRPRVMETPERNFEDDANEVRNRPVGRI